jgi:lipid-binding SYLF domain-containing protein
MFTRIITPALVFAFVAFAHPVFAASPAEERAEIDKAASKVLSDLYKVQPSAKKAVNSAVGYAVFSNFGMKIFFAGGGSGKGYAVRGGKKTYMKMLEVQAGLGLGVKKFGLVWIFNSKSAFNQFVESGWTVGAQATAAAKHEDEGDALQGAIPIADGVFLYQITETGLAAELTVKGTKYYKDDDLN